MMCVHYTITVKSIGKPDRTEHIRVITIDEALRLVDLIRELCESGDAHAVTHELSRHDTNQENPHDWPTT